MYLTVERLTVIFSILVLKRYPWISCDVIFLLQKLAKGKHPSCAIAANSLDYHLLNKVKDIASSTRMAGAVINRQQIISICKGVVRANDPSLLKEFGGSAELSEGWARRLLAKLNWCKRKATTGKVEPPPQYLAEEKNSFQREISTAVFNNVIPPELVINLDQTPLLYVTPGKRRGR